MLNLNRTGSVKLNNYTFHDLYIPSVRFVCIYVWQSLVAAGFVCQIIVRELVKTGKNLPSEGDNRRLTSQFM